MQDKRVRITDAVDGGRSTTEQVIALGRRCSATLGFFPEGAYLDYIAAKHILVALDGETVAGYVAFRTTGALTKLVHLCVDDAYRGHCVARRLVDAVHTRTRQYDGIGLWCRADYNLGDFWRRLGFVPKAERDGRGQDKAVLVYWWLDYGHDDLFSAPSERMQVVADANVMFDLLGEGPEADEMSKGLLADWVQEEIEVLHTDELWTEIDRCADPLVRERHRRKLPAYRQVRPNADDVTRAEEALRGLFPAELTDQDRSDWRHLSRCAASNVPVFVTRDRDLCRKAEQGLPDWIRTKVIHPVTLICQLDEVAAPLKYEPVRLAGTVDYSVTMIDPEDLLAVAERFQTADLGEPVRRLVSRTRKILAEPAESMVLVVQNREGRQLGVCAVQHRTKEVRIPLLKVRCERKSMTYTVARSMIRHVLSGLGSHATTVRVAEPALAATMRTALADSGFIQDANGSYVRIWLPGMHMSETAGRSLDELAGPADPVVSKGSRQEMIAVTNGTREDWLAAEELIWPGILSDADLPCYLVPIKPEWAKHLFDHKAAEGDLFGARDVALNCEFVYYRAPRPGIGPVPARVLWYVMDQQHALGAKQIRAWAHIRAVVVDKPKPLFRRFQRLGVYEWEDVYALAGRKLDGNVMALLVTNAELLSSPVPLAQFQQICRAVGRIPFLQSPWPLPAGVFEAVYRAGFPDRSCTNGS